MLKVILFDFDGVLVESVDIKTTAFAALFQDEGEEDRASILDYHKKHGGISRRNKIIYFYKNILNRALTDEKLKELEQRFSKYVKDKVVQAPFVKGAHEFLRDNHNKYDFYVVSGTPQQELKEIVERKNLNSYFQGVYGSPCTKAEIIESLLSEKKYSKDEVIFIGDSVDDLEGALKCDVRFVARIVPGKENAVFSREGLPVINDFDDLESVIYSLDTR